jgi:hypothetical protein
MINIILSIVGSRESRDDTLYKATAMNAIHKADLVGNRKNVFTNAAMNVPVTLK